MTASVRIRYYESAAKRPNSSRSGLCCRTQSVSRRWNRFLCPIGICSFDELLLKVLPDWRWKRRKKGDNTDNGLTIDCSRLRGERRRTEAPTGINPLTLGKKLIENRKTILRTNRTEKNRKKSTKSKSGSNDISVKFGSRTAKNSDPTHTHTQMDYGWPRQWLKRRLTRSEH